VKRTPLWRISVATLPEAEDAVAGLLESVLNQPSSSYTGMKSGETTVTVYTLEKPARPRMLASLLRSELTRIRSCGLNTGAGRVSIARVPAENWAESWKRHFKPMEIGSALLVKPDWSRRLPRKGQEMVVLNPGLSFGTGQHPTTSFCLRQLVAHRERGGRGSFLDIGTGSGILAIAAARLGFAPVDAMDFDPEAVRTARANARVNGVEKQLRIRCADLTRLPRHERRRYHLICANLVSNLLLSEQARILERLRPDGMLVLAGILKSEFPHVRSAYESAGLKLAASQTGKEWRSGAFVRG
jgi:ribosomal protein L11 methyltransferase